MLTNIILATLPGKPFLLLVYFFSFFCCPIIPLFLREYSSRIFVSVKHQVMDFHDMFNQNRPQISHILVLAYLCLVLHLLRCSSRRTRLCIVAFNNFPLLTGLTLQKERCRTSTSSSGYPVLQ